jgi:hypothetical protein
MTIPLIAFLFFYLLFVLVWLIFSLIGLYHIIRYGQMNAACIFVIIIYLAVSAIILYLSYLVLSQINWNIGLTISQGGAGFFGSSNY